MKPESTRKLISVCALLLGVAWCVFVLFQPIQFLIQNGVDQIDASIFPTVIPLLLPGILLLCFSHYLYRAMNQRALRGIVGTVVTVLVLLMSTSLAPLLPDLFEVHEKVFVLLFGFTLFALPMYIHVVQTLLGYLKEDVPRKLDFMGKGQVMLLCWLLWLVVFHLFKNLLPQDDSVFRLVSNIIPLVFGYGVYRLSMWKLNQLRES